MKIKYAIVAMCLAVFMLVFASCTPEDNSGSGGNPPPTCTHSYVDGFCELCGEEDPEYNPDDSGNNGGQDSGDEDDNSKIPPIDVGGETELPFVPA